ncbi:hypothetical protein DID75_01365 [Candidatus Marinamargulisbacteria bacterium SCGC AG-410-N11]|nr:hypothetical protein DID75_01365 [Candidatus Marinamargulisbacteria bacterium SCGC AG-410-N11]
MKKIIAYPISCLQKLIQTEHNYYKKHYHDNLLFQALLPSIEPLTSFQETRCFMLKNGIIPNNYHAESVLINPSQKNFSQESPILELPMKHLFSNKAITNHWINKNSRPIYSLQHHFNVSIKSKFALFQNILSDDTIRFTLPSSVYQVHVTIAPEYFFFLTKSNELFMTDRSKENVLHHAFDFFVNSFDVSSSSQYLQTLSQDTLRIFDSRQFKLKLIIKKEGILATTFSPLSNKVGMITDQHKLIEYDFISQQFHNYDTPMISHDQIAYSNNNQFLMAVHNNFSDQAQVSLYSTRYKQRLLVIPSQTQRIDRLVYFSNGYLGIIGKTSRHSQSLELFRIEKKIEPSHSLSDRLFQSYKQSLKTIFGCSKFNPKLGPSIKKIIIKEKQVRQLDCWLRQLMDIDQQFLSLKQQSQYIQDQFPKNLFHHLEQIKYTIRKSKLKLTSSSIKSAPHEIYARL